MISAINKASFENFNNLIEIVNQSQTFLGMVYFLILLSKKFEGKQMKMIENNDERMYFLFSDYAFTFRLYVYLQSFTSWVLLIRFLRYFFFLKKLSFVLDVISAAAIDIMFFMLMFSLVLNLLLNMFIKNSIKRFYLLLQYLDIYYLAL